MRSRLPCGSEEYEAEEETGGDGGALLAGGGVGAILYVTSSVAGRGDHRPTRAKCRTLYADPAEAMKVGSAGGGSSSSSMVGGQRAERDDARRSRPGAQRRSLTSTTISLATQSQPGFHYMRFKSFGLSIGIAVLPPGSSLLTT